MRFPNGTLEKVLVIDLEATCWENEKDRPKNETNEIIEVGVALVDIRGFRIEENEGIIVKPIKSTVSPFCTKLTTLTQDVVDKGVSFEQSCQILKDKYRSKDLIWISWGDYDRKQFERQCRERAVEYPFGPRHLNLKNMFALLHGLPKEIGMAPALDLLDIQMQGIHHRGSSDAYNIASILIDTIKKFRMVANGK